MDKQTFSELYTGDMISKKGVTYLVTHNGNGKDIIAVKTVAINIHDRKDWEVIIKANYGGKNDYIKN